MKEVKLTKNCKAYIDDEDYENVSKHSWCLVEAANTRYAYTWIKGKMTSLHNFVMERNGIDHKDGNGLNCQKLNLRPATQSQNGANRGVSLNNTSGYKGVSWINRAKKWQASIRCGKSKFLGYFDDREEAALMYNLAALLIFGEFAHLNKIDYSGKILLTSDVTPW